jgi:hypothetical protein
VEWFSDSHRTALAANIIAEHFFAQIDGEGNRHVLFDEIIAHRTNGKELKQQDAFVLTKSRVKHRKESTAHQVERQEHPMGRSEGFQRVLSRPVGRVCRLSSHR